MRKILIFTLSLFLVFSMSSFAQDLSNEAFIQMQAETQRLIDESGGEWSVGDSKIARMSDDEFRNLLGLLDDPNPPEFYGIERFYEDDYTAALPSSFSLKQYMTSVKNQGSCGSCWAFAANAALEGLLKKNGKTYDLSEQLLVSSCCSAGDCKGGWPGQVASFIKNTGVPEESCYPYKGSNSACSEACSGWKQKAIKAEKTLSVSQSANAIKSAIYNHGPVHLGFVVFPDFQQYNSGIYKWNGSGSSQGKHAVVAVGWNDSNGGYFTVKNSWGTGWGESGYFKIAYSEINNSVQFGQMGNVFSGGGNPPPPDKKGCKGYCGGKAPDGCWCDSSCEQYGDCCSDKKQHCGF